MSAHILHSQRRAGVLLHPTSLPGSFIHGQISHDAYRFIEFLARCGVSVWQLLPLTATHRDGSPYMGLSTHAGDSSLISLDWLVDRGLLPAGTPAKNLDEHHTGLQQAHASFIAKSSGQLFAAFEEFCNKQAYWLDDYTLFMALHDIQGGRTWTTWDTPYRDRHPAALAHASKHYSSHISLHRFIQFVFFTQWQELRAYAQQHNILMFGDMPIYVALDSADVWANRELFKLDDTGAPLTVAGVPPDYFSATGQRWGNPQYRWDAMDADNFRWWQERLRTQLQLFDVIRIDHFRGLRAYWEIPADNHTAIHGRWVTAPGDELLDTLIQSFGSLPLVAEDLGLITADVHELRQKFELPGMKILQFAFDGNPANIYLPHHHEFNAVVYTGTHDNDTTLSWYNALDVTNRGYLHAYFGQAVEAGTIPWLLNRAALASVCCLAVLPMQDLLGLGAGHRMNVPGTTTGNWRWRFGWQQIPDGLPAKLHELITRYDRLPRPASHPAHKP